MIKDLTTSELYERDDVIRGLVRRQRALGDLYSILHESKFGVWMDVLPDELASTFRQCCQILKVSETSHTARTQLRYKITGEDIDNAALKVTGFKRMRYNAADVLIDVAQDLVTQLKGIKENTHKNQKES